MPQAGNQTGNQKEIGERRKSEADRTRNVIRVDEGWAVKRPGARRATGIFSTRNEAVARAEAIVRKLGGGVVVVEAAVQRSASARPSASGGASGIPVRSKPTVRWAHRTERLDELTNRMPEMIEAMMPRSVPTAPAVLQARRNSAARTALIEEFGLLTSADVAELHQSRAENRAALASRWKREGRIFSVRHHGKDYFPGFQLEADGRPRELIAEILEALGGARGWETALWFTAANGYLDGERPVDLLETRSEEVIEAARHEGAEVYF